MCTRSLFRVVRNGLFLSATAMVLAAISGCGSSEVGSVEGVVSYHDKPLEHGRVVFHPEAGRPAFGDIGADGAFILTTRNPEDGALIGNHRVTIHCDKASNPADAFSDRVSLIPTRYQDPETSGLTAEVEAGSNTFNFELTD